MAPLGQKVALDESLMTSNVYNALPHISSMIFATEEHEDSRDKLLQLISAHQVDDVFSVHLIHKHFDAPEDHVMVYETFKSPNHPTFQVLSPRSVYTTKPLRGKFFLAMPGNAIKAYEYTSDPLPDVSQYGEFITAFWHTVVELGLERIFALTVRTLDITEYNEIELPDFRSTVLIPNSDWVPKGVGTDWMIVVEVSDTGVPVREVYNGSKCVPALLHSRATFEDGSQDRYGGDILSLDGVRLSPDSDAFNILSHARQYISVM